MLHPKSDRKRSKSRMRGRIERSSLIDLTCENPILVSIVRMRTTTVGFSDPGLGP